MTVQARGNSLSLVLCAVLGAGAGFLTQTLLSRSGFAPFSPPYSLPASLVVLAAVIVWLGIKLKRAIAHRGGERVNPFHAVRLLAASRAAQYAGSVFFGFGAGLLLPLLGRTVAVSAGVWLPILLTIVAGLVLAGAGAFGEHACRVPPDDHDEDDDGDAVSDATPDLA